MQSHDADNLACDWFAAGLALLGIQAAEALEAVRGVVSGGEVLPGQLHFTAGAHKTLFMPRLISISHATFSQGLKEKRVKGGIKKRSFFNPVHFPANSAMYLSHCFCTKSAVSAFFLNLISIFLAT